MSDTRSTDGTPYQDFTTTVRQPTTWLNDLFQDWLTEHIDEFTEYVLANEGVRLDVRSEPGEFVLSRNDSAFVTPFWGSTWIEATHRAAAVKYRERVNPVHLVLGEQFLFNDQLYVIRSPNAGYGLPAAHLVGHETGVTYIFHPDELPTVAPTGTQIAEARARRQGRVEPERPASVRVPIADSSTFHRVEQNGYVAIGHSDSMWIDTAQTGLHYGYGAVFPELVLYSKNERRRIVVHMNIDDWMQAIGRLLDQMKKHERKHK